MIDERIASIKSEQTARYEKVKDFSIDSLSVNKYFKWKDSTDKELDKLLKERSRIAS